jgi:hypothetical protein
MSFVEHKVSLINLMSGDLNAKTLFGALSYKVQVPCSIVEGVMKVPYNIMLGIKLKHNTIFIFCYFIARLLICPLFIFHINIEQTE